MDIPALLETSGASDIETFLDWAGPLLLGVALLPEARDDLAAALRAAGAGDTLETARVIIAGLLASPSFQWR